MRARVWDIESTTSGVRQRSGERQPDAMAFPATAAAAFERVLDREREARSVVADLHCDVAGDRADREQHLTFPVPKGVVEEHFEDLGDHLR